MAFDIERFHKATRRVRKFLKKNSKRPTSKAIHDLRTSIRSLETTSNTLQLRSRKTRDLLRAMRDIRKRAGKVRDMDVLTADALTVRPEGEQDCLVQLLEYLGAERNKSAKRLRRFIRLGGRQHGEGLKRNSKRVEKVLKAPVNQANGSDAASVTMARTLKLSSDLQSPA